MQEALCTCGVPPALLSVSPTWPLTSPLRPQLLALPGGGTALCLRGTSRGRRAGTDPTPWSWAGAWVAPPAPSGLPGHQGVGGTLSPLTRPRPAEVQGLGTSCFCEHSSPDSWAPLCTCQICVRLPREWVSGDRWTDGRLGQQGVWARPGQWAVRAGGWVGRRPSPAGGRKPLPLPDALSFLTPLLL